MPSLKILIVDDDRSMRAMVRLSLELTGAFSLIECENPEEAVAFVTRYQPDIVLLDMRMPGMDGLAVFSCLQQTSETSATPVIFLTADPKTCVLASPFVLGKIEKPFNLKILGEQIMALWEKRMCR